MTRIFRNRLLVDGALAVVVFILALAVYNATLAPSLSYKSPDGNELATVVYTLGLAHSTGYPLYTWLGKLFTFLPVGDVAHRVNLMSATMGAGGVAITYLLLRHLGVRRSVAVFAALLFAFSLTFWSQTGIAEVYAPNLFMVALTTLTLLLWATAEESRPPDKTWLPLALSPWKPTLLLWASALLLGLSLGTHMSNLGFVPAMVMFVFLIRRRLIYRRPLVLIGGAMSFALGAAQFLWLPYKAATLNDPLMLRHAPSTLEGIYRYTLGAFPQFKFAFPIQAIPDRIVLYLWLLCRQYTVAGVLIGLHGMVELAVHRPRRFLLLVGMYLVHVWFFVQYRAFDLDVFFIPAHWIYVLFIGFALHRLLGYAVDLCRYLTRWGLPRKAGAVMQVGMGIAFAALIALEVDANWQENDYSHDTAIPDFYLNAFDLLPRGSVLLGRRGVFGFDMFHWRLVYGLRPDVAIPLVDGRGPRFQAFEEGAVYTTDDPRPGRRTPWSSGDLLPAGAWYVPVLLGRGGVGHGPMNRGLTLYRVSDAPPRLTVPAKEVRPQRESGAQLDGLRLVGYDLDDSLARPGGRLHIVLYWQLEHRGAVRSSLALTLGDTTLEVHPLGLGNLTRYIRETHPPAGEVVVEDYWVVIPSTFQAGSYSLAVCTADQARPGGEAVGECASLGEVELQSVPCRETPTVRCSNAGIGVPGM